MDYKKRLHELCSQEASKNQDDQNRREFFKNQQKAVFAEIVVPFKEICEAAGDVISETFIGESFARLKIAGSGSPKTTYDFEPNSTGKFSLSPSPAPGFSVKTETTYDNGIMYIEPTEREYQVKDADSLLEDLMKHIAEAMAKSR